MPIISKEKLKKPRILLLDFDLKVVRFLKNEGYNVFAGSSGYSEKKLNIPIHYSELELLFWDCSSVKVPTRTYPRLSYLPAYVHPGHPYREIEVYSQRIKNKGGIVTLILGRNISDYDVLSRATGYDFSLKRRLTTTIFPNAESVFEPFFERFIRDENIRFAIEWGGNLVNYSKFFLDEDGNHHASFSGNLLILPYIEDKKNAILMLLQDVFPRITDDEIFPSLATYEWLKDKEFAPAPVKAKIKERDYLRKSFEKRKKSLAKKISELEARYFYLRQALIADDSELFPEDKRLKPQVIRMLKVLGFKVTDIDIKRKVEGKSLAEDLQIEDGKYLALGETKGTEGGAKANWAKKDLASNRALYMTAKDLKPSEINSMLIFNHERRIDPRKRSTPFKSDPDLVMYCEKMNITLVPVYQLYLLCNDVLFKGFDKKRARSLLKKPGLFNYKNN